MSRAQPSIGITALTALGLGLLACRAFVDGAYSVPALPTLYFGAMLAILSLAALERGRLPGARAPASFDAPHALFVLALLAYIIFELLNLWRTNLWGLGDALKRLSPFLLLLVLPLNNADALRRTLLFYAFSVILVNAATVPFGFAWTTWGSTNTLTGIYFYKTDLAFALVTALLLIVLLLPGQRWLIAACTVVVGTMIALSNARLNYATFLVVVIYALTCRGLTWRGIAVAAACIAVFGSLALWLVEARSQVSAFDFHDIRRFTQGRSHIWGLLVDEMVWYYDVREMLFGRGYRYDILLALLHSPRAVFDSHNELLSQLVTRGMIGLLAYVAIWTAAIRFVLSRFDPGQARNRRRYALLAIVSLLLLQSLTGVVSEYSTKTWPFLFCILAACIGVRDVGAEADAPSSTARTAPRATTGRAAYAVEPA